MKNKYAVLPSAVVITGGSGYIGSVIAHHLIELGYGVVVIDKQPLPRALITLKELHFFQGDYADHGIWQRITSQFTCKVVIHLAARIEVGESVVRPAEYYNNNVATLIAMLEILKNNGIYSIIAASSSAVYGNPCELPIPETHRRIPLSPYARTKTMLEDILMDYHAAYGFTSALLRFANVAGGLPRFGLGECHEPETHLIPRLIKAVQRDESFLLYGTDHDTADGTCVRDFVHVYDVARLHGMIVNLWSTQSVVSPLVLNVGSGRGTSVREMITHVGAVMNKHVIVEEMPRRTGDAPSIVLDIRDAYQLVGWKPIMSDVGTIVASAYEFHQAQANFSRAISSISHSLF